MPLRGQMYVYVRTHLYLYIYIHIYIYIYRHVNSCVSPRSLAPGRGKALRRSQPRTSAECFRGESPAAAPSRRASPAGTALGDPADKDSSVRIQTPAPRERREFSASARLHGKKKKTNIIRLDTAPPVRNTLTFPLPGEGMQV